MLAKTMTSHSLHTYYPLEIVNDFQAFKYTQKLLKPTIAKY